MYEDLQQELNRIIFDKSSILFKKKKKIFCETTLQLWLSFLGSFDQLLAFWTCFLPWMAKEGVVEISPTGMQRKKHWASSSPFPPPMGKCPTHPFHVYFSVTAGWLSVLCQMNSSHRRGWEGPASELPNDLGRCCITSLLSAGRMAGRDVSSTSLSSEAHLLDIKL